MSGWLGQLLPCVGAVMRLITVSAGMDPLVVSRGFLVVRMEIYASSVRIRKRWTLYAQAPLGLDQARRGHHLARDRLNSLCMTQIMNW